MEKLLALLSAYSALKPAYEIAREIGDKAEIYLTAVDRWLLKRYESPESYIKNVVENFGGLAAYSCLPGAEPERGKFFIIEKEPAKELTLTSAESDQRIARAQYIVSLGIDANGGQYLQRYLPPLKSLLPDSSEAISVIYHYSNSAEERGNDMAALLGDYDYISRESRNFAKIFSLNPALPKTRIGHSYGAIGRMVQNALSVELGRPNDNINSVMFAAPPFWGQRYEKNRTKASQFDKMQQGASINIVFASDLMPYLTGYGRKAIEHAALYPGTKPFIAYHHPENLNKAWVILTDLAPTKVGHHINYAGHGFAHYIDAIGLGQDGATIIPGLEKVKLAVLRVAHHHPSLAIMSLAEELGAAALNKGLFTDMDVDSLPSKAGYWAQILNEANAWKGKREHPFVR